MKEANRARKGEIKEISKITLTEEQKLVKQNVYDKDVNFVLGNYGTGKTQVSICIALELLFKKHVDKIIISRPTDFNATGWLKGGLTEKMEYHIMPIKQCLYAASAKDKIDGLLEDGTIQVLNIGYMKGITFSNACVVIDEFEDINFEDFSLILTRLGKDSKLIFCGSEEQTKKDFRESCIKQVKCLKGSDLVGYNTLTSDHRNESIKIILKYIEENGK